MGQSCDTTIHGLTGESRMGGSQTDWSLILTAADHAEEREVSQAALEKLVRRYWPAIYAYLLASGQGPDAAADLTQGFVCDVVLERKLFDHADPSRGRFRRLLLTSLQNYVLEESRNERRQVRRPPSGPPLQLEPEELQQVQADRSLSPDAAFMMQWSITLIRTVLERVRERCRVQGLGPHWEVFEERVAKPLLTGGKPTDYATLVNRLSLEDPAQAANLMITVKRRFARALQQEVAQTVTDPLQVPDELQRLTRALEGRE